MNDHHAALGQMPSLEATWQGAIIRFPTLNANDPNALGACLWADLTNQRVQPGEPKPLGDLSANDLLDSMMMFAKSFGPAGARPKRIEVADAAVCEMLRQKLDGSSIEIALVPSLQIVDVLADGMQRMHQARVGQFDRLESVPGVTESQLRRFAEAAKAFFNTEPWTHFDSMMLLHIVSPKVDKAFRYVNVMGGGGEAYGLAFFPSYSRFERMMFADDPMQFTTKYPAWSITFDPAINLMPGDLETWQRLKLPVCRGGMYPVPLCFFDERFEYPSADQLGDMELILRTMASLKTKDFEKQNRKQIFVGTADAPRKVTVELQRLTDPMQELGRLAEMINYLQQQGQEVSLGPKPSPRKSRPRKRRG